MTNPLPQLYSIRQMFSLFEAFDEAARGWSLDFRQLGPVASPFLLEQVMTGPLIYGRARLGAAFHQQGGSPPGYRTFSILASGSADFRWCGDLMTSDCMLVMPENGEFDSYSSPGLDTFHLSLSLDLLQMAALRQLGLPIDAVLGTERVFCRGAGERVLQLRSLLLRYSDALAEEKAEGAKVVQAPEGFEYQLAQLAVEILAATSRVSPGESGGRRRQAVTRALDYLQESDGSHLAVSDLVRESGVSRRTLESAFQDALGTSPAYYLKVCRLHALRRSLHRACPESASVAELGKAAGFGHGGQLAADYLRLFGEAPSVTLRRS